MKVFYIKGLLESKGGPGSGRYPRGSGKEPKSGKFSLDMPDESKMKTDRGKNFANGVRRRFKFYIQANDAKIDSVSYIKKNGSSQKVKKWQDIDFDDAVEVRLDWTMPTGEKRNIVVESRNFN